MFLSSRSAEERGYHPNNDSDQGGAIERTSQLTVKLPAPSTPSADADFFPDLPECSTSGLLLSPDHPSAKAHDGAPSSSCTSTSVATAGPKGKLVMSGRADDGITSRSHFQSPTSSYSGNPERILSGDGRKTHPIGNTRGAYILRYPAPHIAFEGALQ